MTFILIAGLLLSALILLAAREPAIPTLYKQQARRNRCARKTGWL